MYSLYGHPQDHANKVAVVVRLIEVAIQARVAPLDYLKIREGLVTPLCGFRS